ncbi:MAG: Glu/Leu/Phe/Val dehydrogenase dimerization domain-containing protein [Acidobacteriota bacterium]
MSDHILPLIDAWPGNGVFVHRDGPTGTWIFIALHSSALGMPLGGSRMKSYPGLTDAVTDAMRLAAGMTAKWAGLDMPFGGAKAVLAVERPLEGDERRDFFLRYGALIESLRGAYATGADLGTGPDDMATIAERTEYVFGVDRDTGEPTDPGPFTARGVFEGIRSGVAHAFDGADLEGRSVLIQGLGGVGGPLAHLLRDAGAELLLTDLDGDRAGSLAEELGGRAVPSDGALAERCDVFAPCATGGVLNAESIPRLGCRLVAGSANNQLAVDDDATRLHERGILYVPDYIINAGGAMALPLMAQGLKDRDALLGRSE